MRMRVTFLAVLVAVLIGTAGVAPRPANAQFGIQFVQILQDYPRQTQSIISKALDQLKQRLKDIAALAYKNGLRSYLSKIVQENLLSIATGNPGQKPLFLTNPGKYFNDVATSSTLDYLDLASGQLEGQAIAPGDQSYDVQRLVRGVVEGNAPQAICRTKCEAASEDEANAIEAARSMLRAAQAVASRDPNQTVDCLGTTEPAPLCVTEMQDFIRVTQATVDDSVKACMQQKCASAGPGIIFDQPTPSIQGKPNTDVLTQLNRYFIGTGSPVGQLGALYTASLSAGSDAEKAARDTAGSAVGPLLSTITGEIRVPSTGTGALLVQSILVSTNAESIRTGSFLADAFDVFAKTLISRLRQNLLQNPCGLNIAGCKGPNTTSQLSNLLFGSGGQTGIAGARIQFASIGRVDYRTGDPAKTPIQPEDLLQSQGLIDTQFRAAIQEKLTVQEALDKGLLDPGRTFGFDKNGKEPLDGYSYRSLVYLRKYRIVPVGWELAALYNRDVTQSRENLNLKQLTEAYNQCGQGACSGDATVSCTVGADILTTQKECGTNGSCIQQPLSPYCGLVDPDWVLKAPETFCRRQGAGEEIVSRQFICDDTNGDGKVNCDATGADIGRWDIQRSTDTCSDEQSCIAENPDGSCRAFGYCVIERSSFRFDGTQCQAPFSSCTTYTSAGGQEVSYNANTLDTRGCSAGSVGCGWYCAKTCSGNPAIQCAVDADCGPTGGTCTNGVDASGNWLCTAANGTPQSGTTRSFTAAVQSCGPSEVGCRQFQRTTGGANLLAGSSVEYYTGTSNDGQPDSFDPNGGGTGWATTGGAVTQAVTGDTATGSATALRLSGSGAIQSTSDTGSALADRSFTLSFAGRAELGSCSGGFALSVGGTSVSGTADYSSAWKRFAITLGAPPAYIPSTVTATALVTQISVPPCAVLVDDLKLEEGVAATAYRDYGADAIQLAGSRTQCPAAAVGCQSYQPTAGGPAVPGIVKPADSCPVSDVGCRSFTEVAVRNGTDSTLPARQSRALSLVPSTGQTCSAADVGCEEFTNLDTVAAGGEAREYFKQIKLCVKPGASSTKTYYTWTGSDTLGYKLEAYTYKVSNLADSFWGSGSGRGPCTNLAFSGVANPDPACNDSATASASNAARTCLASDVGVNPDCRDYFDENLKHFYVLEPYAIRVTDDCHPYRNTLDDSSGATKIYTISPGESARCGAGAAQCRAYAGSASANTTIVLRDDFEDADTLGWTGGAISNTAISVGGHSMRVPGSAYYDLSSVAVDGATYTVTVWAASDSGSGTNLSVRLTPNADGTCNPGVTCSTPAQVLPAPAGTTYKWNRYVFGPLQLIGDPSNQKLFVTASPSTNFFVDNVELTAVVDNVFLLRDSFRTCTGNENCSAYTVSGQTVALKSFSGLCQQQYLGCEAVYNTQNSASPFSETPFIRGQSISPPIPADTVETWVNDPRKYCASSALGCTAYGRPALDVSGTVAGYTTVYLKDQPDTYSSTICHLTELWCQAYSTKDGTAYFKDPGQQVCEYASPTGLAAGWYRRGTTLPCSTVAVSGTTYRDATLDRCELRVTGGIEQWCYRSSPDTVCIPCVARLCPGEQNGCTEYLDPAEPLNCNPNCAYVEQGGVSIKLDAKCRPTANQSTGQVGCRGYYQLQDTVNAGDCNGIIDPKLGCKAFNDTEGGTLNLRSSPTP